MTRYFYGAINFFGGGGCKNHEITAPNLMASRCVSVGEGGGAPESITRESEAFVVKKPQEWSPGPEPASQEMSNIWNV